MEIISRQKAIETQSSLYFTGKLCAHGHISQRRVANGVCVECHRISQSKLNAKNRVKPSTLNKSKTSTRGVAGKTQLTRESIYKNGRKFVDANPDKIKEYSKKHYLLNKSIVKVRSRSNRLYRNHSIRLDDYTSMLSTHNGKCDVCGTERAGGPHNKFNLDHCHTTGDLRGILCFRCNVTLGQAEDRIELLEKLIKYLRNPPRKAILEFIRTGDLSWLSQT